DTTDGQRGLTCGGSDTEGKHGRRGGEGRDERPLADWFGTKGWNAVGNANPTCTARKCRVNASLLSDIVSSVHSGQSPFCFRTLWMCPRVVSCRRVVRMMELLGICWTL